MTSGERISSIIYLFKFEKGVEWRVGVGLLLRIEFSFLQKSFIETMVLLVCLKKGWWALDGLSHLDFFKP